MEYQDMSNSFSVNWCNSAKEISSAEWESIFGKSIIKRQQFFQAMEEACFLNIDYQYLQVKKHGTIISIVPCFCCTIDILNLTTSSTAKYIIQHIRKMYSDFLCIRAFVTGTYAASCEHFIGCKSGLSSEDKKTINGIINQQLKNKCKETKSKFIFIKDVRERDIIHVKQILDKDFYFFSSFPTTVIPVLPLHTYPLALKSKYRKRYYDNKKVFEQNFAWEVVVDYASYIPQFTTLYNNVLQKAKNKFEFLNVAFFNNINVLYPDDSFLLLAKDKEGEIRIFILILEDAESLIPLYMGVKYQTDDTRVLYINALGRMVKEAEYRKKSYVDLGQTSYYPKVMSGAFVEDVRYGFWSNHYLLKWLIKNVFHKIFVSQYIPKNIYLEKYKTFACEFLEKNGFCLLNK